MAVYMAAVFIAFHGTQLASAERPQAVPAELAVPGELRLQVGPQGHFAVPRAPQRMHLDRSSVLAELSTDRAQSKQLMQTQPTQTKNASQVGEPSQKVCGQYHKDKLSCTRTGCCLWDDQPGKDQSPCVAIAAEKTCVEVKASQEKERQQLGEPVKNEDSVGEANASSCEKCKEQFEDEPFGQDEPNKSDAQQQKTQEKPEQLEEPEEESKAVQDAKRHVQTAEEQNFEPGSFQACDVDGDGEIDLNEFKLCLTDKEPEHFLENAQSIFDKVDDRKQHSLLKDDWDRALIKKKPPISKDMFLTPREMLERIIEIEKQKKAHAAKAKQSRGSKETKLDFWHVDLDGSGAIDFEEFKRILADKAIGADRALEIFRSIDTDKSEQNEKLEFNEAEWNKAFIDDRLSADMFKKPSELARLRVPKSGQKGHWDTLDLENGNLDTQGFQEAFQGLSPTAVTKLFEKLDTDSSGAIDEEEWNTALKDGSIPREKLKDPRFIKRRSPKEPIDMTPMGKHQTGPMLPKGDACQVPEINEILKTHNPQAFGVGNWGFCYYFREGMGDLDIFLPTYAINVTTRDKLPCDVIAEEDRQGTVNVEARALDIIVEGKLSNCPKLGRKDSGAPLKSIFSGETILMNRYYARPPTNPVMLTLSAGMPGVVFALDIPKGTSWFIAPGSFVAGTPNVATTPGSPNDVLKEPMQWTKITLEPKEADPDENGVVFAAALGHAESLHIPEGHRHYFNKDHLLAFGQNDVDIQYVEDKHPNERGSISMMTYKAPKDGGHIILQLRSLYREALHWSKFMPHDCIADNKDKPPPKDNGTGDSLAELSHSVDVNATVAGQGLKKDSSQRLMDGQDESVLDFNMRRSGSSMLAQVIKFWGQDLEDMKAENIEAEALVEEATCLDGKKGFMLRATTKSPNPYPLCFLLHRSEVQVVFQEKDAQMKAEQGTVVYSSHEPEQEISVSKPGEAEMANATYGKVMETRYTRTADSGNVYMGFGAKKASDIIPIVLQPGDIYLLKVGTYVCSTANVDLVFIDNFQDMFEGKSTAEKSLFIQRAKVSDGQNGVIFLEAAGLERMHRISGEKSLKIDSGLYLASEWVEDKTDLPYTPSWSGGEDDETMEDKLLKGEALLMEFVQKKLATESTGRSRVVIAQSLNFKSYARKIIGQMPGCPCANYKPFRNAYDVSSVSLLEAQPESKLKRLAGEHESGKRANGLLQKQHLQNVTQRSIASRSEHIRSLHKQNHENSVAQQEEDAEFKSALMPRPVGEFSEQDEHVPKDAIGLTYKLKDGVKVKEIGLEFATVGLKIIEAPAVEGEQKVLTPDGAVVEYHNEEITAYAQEHEDIEAQGGPGATWNQLDNKITSQGPGWALVTAAGAEDLMKIDIDKHGKAYRWRIQPGHTLATDPNVDISAKWMDSGNAEIQGIMQQTLSTDTEGQSAWIWGYGHLHRHVLGKDDVLVVDDRHFVAAKCPVKWEFTSAPDTEHSFFRGRTMLKFQGAGEVITQAKNLHGFVEDLCPASLAP